MYAESQGSGDARCLPEAGDCSGLPEAALPEERICPLGGARKPDYREKTGPVGTGAAAGRLHVDRELSATEDAMPRATPWGRSLAKRPQRILILLPDVCLASGCFDVRGGLTVARAEHPDSMDI